MRLFLLRRFVTLLLTLAAASAVVFVVLDVLPADAGQDGKHKQVALVRDKIKLEEQAARKSVIAAAEGDAFDEVMMPLSLALAERCDAVLRIGGPSGGADAEVARFTAAGKPVFRAIEDIPPCP